MIVRSLDGNHDFTFGKGKQDYLTEQDAIAQNIQTKLLSFINDCFFDMDAGVDWRRLLGSKNTENEIVLSCRAVILDTEGVVRINSLSSSVQNRQIIVEYNISTIYSNQFQQTLEIVG